MFRLDARDKAGPESGLHKKGLPWYAIRVKSRFERAASQALRYKGYEEFLPVYRSRRRWSDRLKEVDLPLFAGYLFCRFDATDRLLPILMIPGVLSILGAGKIPLAVDDDEVVALRALVHSGLSAYPAPYLPTGCRVYVEGGPLAGMQGIVKISPGDKRRLVISVSLLQRSVAVEIEQDWLRPIEERTRCARPGGCASWEDSRLREKAS